MCSAPSRDKLASTSAMNAFRDRPAPFGPSCIRPWTLVAITNSSRRPKSLRPPADDLLARAGGVHVRCVEKVDPRLNCLTDQRSAALLVQCPRVGATLRIAEAHAAQHEPRNLQPRAPQTYVFHRASSLLWPRRSSAAITGSWIVFLASDRKLLQGRTAASVGSCIGERAAEIEDAFAEEVPIAFGGQVLRLVCAELSRPRNECRAESRPLGKREIAIVGRREHDLARIQPKDPRHVLIRLHGRLVGPGRIRTYDHGPGQFCPQRHPQ